MTVPRISGTRIVSELCRDSGIAQQYRPKEKGDNSNAQCRRYLRAVFRGILQSGVTESAYASRGRTNGVEAGRKEGKAHTFSEIYRAIGKQPLELNSQLQMGYLWHNNNIYAFRDRSNRAL